MRLRARPREPFTGPEGVRVSIGEWADVLLTRARFTDFGFSDSGPTDGLD